MSDLPESVTKLKNRFIFIFVVIFALAYVYEADTKGIIDIGLPSESINTVGTYYKVDRSVDGDTIKVVIGDQIESVRLLGINTPETVDPRRTVECFGKEASERMEELVEGKIVRLEYDDSQGYRDTYGRILAYVYLEDGQMVNRKMIAEGYAYEYTYLTPYQHQREFRQLQNLAKGGQKGLWATNSCNGQK
ncbi:MAG: thermonuclease family protein [Candidatus Pacebacteria bacterium]|nr:thermonuclease family protein [Candidatus Paceibacterota bacterium]